MDSRCEGAEVDHQVRGGGPTSVKYQLLASGLLEGLLSSFAVTCPYYAPRLG